MTHSRTLASVIWSLEARSPGSLAGQTRRPFRHRSAPRGLPGNQPRRCRNVSTTNVCP